MARQSLSGKGVEKIQAEKITTTEGSVAIYYGLYFLL
jgi:hypothetical protein